MKLWGGRFSKETAVEVEEFTASIGFDRRLWEEDIAGSLAHVKMLAKVGVLTAEEAATISRGLEEIREEIKSGAFTFSAELEDIHMHIERRLIEKVGPVGGKVHTARSRNDQVALDTHLWVLRKVDEVLELIGGLQAALVKKARAHQNAILPGYTHLQHAQPVLWAHHLLAYFEMLERDRARFLGCRERADLMPLGAGALAGTTFPIDREFVARELGFSKLYENSLDAVSDRDYILEFISASAILMVHLSRLAEELILWSSREFGFVELDDAYSTGSSIMPQKKNPDVPELVRGKTGRVVGHLTALLMVLKGLPLAYNKDLQEDKEALFDTADTVCASLKIFAGLIATLKVNEGRMLAAARGDFSTATDLADYLACRGMPFREAHAVVGRLVQECLAKGKTLEDLTLDELQAASPLFGPDALAVLQVEHSVERRTSRGGTAPSRVEEALRRAEAILSGRGAL
ncbi:MAG: argininosuccinate lyase [Bacillota bacterium]|jgi:argininosuccinate lyase|nr:argininosuccinate lyase [Bacillota bacterium]MDK2925734.1 argininosuccinate lyase [Bacillota bacterium]